MLIYLAYALVLVAGAGVATGVVWGLVTPRPERVALLKRLARVLKAYTAEHLPRWLAQPYGLALDQLVIVAERRVLTRASTREITTG